ncbi:TPA: hypothetical protein I8Y21_004470 [Klebsiella oxytoca]|uniref:Uncharacterized protein n=1 Tax=Klebsiella oxytoca TaxID=571 RepID=A0AAN5LC56_KLEOX|nr:hypothetical protein [Klebsiella oxytoca]
MWKKVTLSLKGTPAPVTCSLCAAHPWDAVTGHVTPDGCYLSPVNAVTHLAGLLGGVENTHDVVVLMVCADDMTGFIKQLDAVAQVLPVPVLTQTLRRARTQLTQAVTRMQIPAALSGGLPAPQPLIVSTLQKAVSGQSALAAMQSTGPGGLDSIRSALANFKQQRRDILNTLTSELAGTGSLSADVHAFVMRGNVAQARADLLKAIPVPSSSLTLALMLTGDLTTVTGWLSET